MAAPVIAEDELMTLGAEVAVGDIDAELHRFFTGGAPRDGEVDGEENPAGIARASLLNLAVYAEDATSVQDLTATIEELTRETACRAILILAQTAGETSVRSWVQAHCRLTEQGEKTVCTEQVSFVLAGANASLVRNTVFAHLDSDLPLVFWWKGELSDVFEERLTSRLDRFLFDSACWAQPANQFLRLQQALEESGGAFVAHDLAYTRCHPLRIGIARIFDDGAARKALDELESFEIEYAAGQRIVALWLAAWIAGRLGGRLDQKRSDADRFRFRSERFGEFAIVAREDGIESPEAVKRLGMDFGKAGQIEISHDADSGFWRLDWNLADSPAREKLYPGKPRSDADLVSEILIRAGRNRAMCEAMPMLRKLVVL